MDDDASAAAIVVVVVCDASRLLGGCGGALFFIRVGGRRRKTPQLIWCVAADPSASKVKHSIKIYFMIPWNGKHDVYSQGLPVSVR